MDQNNKNSKPFHQPNKYSSKKSVTFQKIVDIFHLTDAWQLNVRKSNLKTEEDQARRRILQRNF